MTKQQKLDKVLCAVLEVIKQTTGDTLRYKDCRHTMSDQTYAAIDNLHIAYRDMDFFKYEEAVSEGLNAAVHESKNLKETHEQRADYAIQTTASEGGDAS